MIPMTVKQISRNFSKSQAKQAIHLGRVQISQGGHQFSCKISQRGVGGSIIFSRAINVQISELLGDYFICVSECSGHFWMNKVYVF